MPGEQRLHYNEGGGFVFVQALGSGAARSAVLVRSLLDNQLYVHKEAKHPRKGSTAGTASVQKESTNIPTEVVNVNLAKGVQNIVQPVGWVQYRSPDDRNILEVSYWKYCNAGTLFQLQSESYDKKIAIPERWVCQWLMTMLDIILGLHAKGLRHTDGHSENWLLHRSNNEADPEILLGDFDAAYIVPKDRSQDMVSLRDLQKDFCSIRDIISVCARQSYVSAQLHSIIDLLSTHIRESKSDSRYPLSDGAREVRDAAQSCIRYCDPTDLADVPLAVARHTNVLKEHGKIQQQNIRAWEAIRTVSIGGWLSSSEVATKFEKRCDGGWLPQLSKQRLSSASRPQEKSPGLV